MTFADAWEAHEYDEEQDRLAADQTPATKRCGECRLGLGVHTPTDPYCAHHQTPATDSERDERLREARVLAAEVRADLPRYSKVGRSLVALDDEVTRLTASAAAGQELLNNHRCDEAAEGSYRRAIAADAEVARLTALLAEQAATIERLTADAQQTDWPTAARSILALGSQRTEGQG